MNNNTIKITLIIITIIILSILNILIFQKENTLKNSKSVLLELAPVDPRSLIQGDYMVLNYKISREAAELSINVPAQGSIVICLDDNNVATFVDFYKGNPLGPDEILLNYRIRNGLILGAESFFFQEGHAKYYEKARYGELKVTPSGQSILVGLRDEKFRPIHPNLN